MAAGVALDQSNSILKVEETGWEVVSSMGTTFSLQEFKNKNGGFRVKKHRTDSSEETNLFYHGLGYSKSTSPPERISISITGSALMKDSAGARIFKMPFAGKSLGINELRGTFVMYELTGNLAVAGESGFIMFISGVLSNGVATVAGGLYLAQYVPALIASSNACVISMGVTANNSLSIDSSIAVGGYFGVIY